MACQGGEFGKSYFCLQIDNESQPYFTFLSEYNRSWSDAATLEAFVLISIFCLSIPGNVLVLIYIGKIKARQTLTKYFIGNLVIADIAFASTAPFTAYIRLQDTWVLGQSTCSVLEYWMFVCASVSIWTMTLISIGRYRYITQVTSSYTRLIKQHYCIICIGIWLICAVSFLPIAFFFQVKETRFQNKTLKMCTLLWPKGDLSYSESFTVLVVILMCMLPLLIISVNYYRIYLKFYESRRAVENSDPQTVRRTQRCLWRNARHQRVIRTLTNLVVAFVAMYLPTVIVIVVIEDDVSHSHNEVPSSALVWAMALAYLNTVLNAVLYGSLFTDLPKIMRRCWAGQSDTTTGQQDPQSVNTGIRNVGVPLRTITL
ncbi:neuropeptide Y receptor type 1-like [Dreissena polymorpha]|uniref:G-protein coupled receptors family 1 profile domain-containing protein n=1 Tax=Dreissena polymorpha TaxID=45954 RepID=A0A9D3YWS0_DREPO|nr:neuropeptide Y receptor type 1-like [Dreissena polymorpha]KAH3707722.1 hypothetical protein DPMN_067133 [Dreissena polymorpha]